MKQDSRQTSVPSTKVPCLFYFTLIFTPAFARSPPDFVTAKAYYTFGFASKDPSLQEVASGTFYGKYFKLSSELFDGAQWIDEQLLEAFKDDGMSDTAVANLQVTIIFLLGLRCVIWFSLLERFSKGPCSVLACSQTWNKHMMLSKKEMRLPL